MRNTVRLKAELTSQSFEQACHQWRRRGVREAGGATLRMIPWLATEEKKVHSPIQVYV
jgi:hypothetical protein